MLPPLRRRGTVAAGVALLVAALPAPAYAATQSFHGTGTYTVPAGATKVRAEAVGAHGMRGAGDHGGAGGNGAHVTGVVRVSPGQLIHVIVGRGDSPDGGAGDGSTTAGHGGGATWLQTCPWPEGALPCDSPEQWRASVLLVAGGGGGGGAGGDADGGGGGSALTSGAGGDGGAGTATAGGVAGTGGTGATATAAGGAGTDAPPCGGGTPATPGILGFGGDGGLFAATGGGGGGGLFGGGGGGAGGQTACAGVLGGSGGGGAGASFAPAGATFAVAAPDAAPAAQLEPVWDPPAITITQPADGAVYTTGQAVTSDFSCAKGDSSAGVATCADGSGAASPSAPIDTSRVGVGAYAVEATSVEGRSARKQVTYFVKAPGTPRPPLPTPQVQPPSGRVSFPSSRVRVVGRRASVAVRCSRRGNTCRGKVAISVRRGKRSWRQIAKGSFSVAAGATRTVRLTITKADDARLWRAHRRRASAMLTLLSSSQLVNRAVTLERRS